MAPRLLYRERRGGTPLLPGRDRVATTLVCCRAVATPPLLAEGREGIEESIARTDSRGVGGGGGGG